VVVLLLVLLLTLSMRQRVMHIPVVPLRAMCESIAILFQMLPASEVLKDRCELIANAH